MPEFLDIPPQRLPPFLEAQTAVLEPEDLPLQVLLLTQEMAATRRRLELLAQTLTVLAEMMRPDAFGEWSDG